LQVIAAGRGDLGDRRSVGGGGVRPEFLKIGVDLAGYRVAAAAEMQRCRRRDGELGGRRCNRFQELEVLDEDRLAASQLAGNRRHRRHVLRIERHASRRLRRHAVEACGEVQVPVVAAHLAIGDRAQPDGLLPLYRGADTPVLDLLQRRGADVSFLESRAGTCQLGGTQQAADVVGAVGRIHARSLA
jgi:hypothetical protein